MPPKITLPTDDELELDHRELLATLPPLNVFRMVAGAPRAVRPFMALGAAVLSTALDAAAAGDRRAEGRARDARSL